MLRTAVILCMTIGGGISAYAFLGNVIVAVCVGLVCAAIGAVIIEVND